MSAAPPGWVEVFRGPCVQGDVVHAALEANGLRVVTLRTSPEAVFSGLAFEQCRIFVPDVEAEQARELLKSERPGPEALPRR